MVIDTPLGNADSQYRPRVLQEITKADFLDQVIILSHDEEIDATLAESVAGQTKQKFLVKYCPDREESIVYPNQYFGE